MKYKTTIYGINPKDLPDGYYEGLQMCLTGAKKEIYRLTTESELIQKWDKEKQDKISYLGKSIDFFVEKLGERK